MAESRPTSLVSATVLLLIGGLMNLIPFDAFISYDASDERPPKVVIYGAYVLGVLLLAAAYGVWKRQRWGMFVGVIVSVIGVLSALPGVFFAPVAWMQLSAGIGVVLGVATIYALVMPATRRSYAS